MARITILGDGAWGTAIAQLLAENGHECLIWCHNAAVAQQITTHHTNTIYLPGIALNERINATTDIAEAFAFSSRIAQAIPIKFLRTVLQQAQPFITEQHEWIILSKGIENDTGMLSSEIIQDVLARQIVFCVISGPSYAHDIARHQPTRVIIAATDQPYAQTSKKLFDNSFFGTHLSTDVIGVQLCAAFKNVAAIIIGILEGAGYGDNTITVAAMCALNEMKQLVRGCTGHPETVYSYAGLGDFMLTAFGKRSKNKQAGMLIGQGKTLKQIIQQTGILPEGINTLTSIVQLSKKHKIQLPLCVQTGRVIFENEPIASLVNTVNGE